MDDYALDIGEWKEFIEECEAFSIVFRPQKKRYYLLVLEDGFQFIDAEMLDEVIETWKLLT